MLTFWGILSEEEISAYAGTLILPSFMAHLERAPFRFGEQASNVDGLQPLKISYVGEGRYEEFFIHPEKHASPILQSVCPNSDPERIRFRQGETLWRWSSDFWNGRDDKLESAEQQPTLMRIYFESVAQTLPDDIFHRFDPKQCYVSVTRMEIFLSKEVIREYFSAWLNLLENNSYEKRSDVLPEIEAIAGGFVFHGHRLGGEFVLQDNETLRDMFRFCGLAKSLDELSSLVRPDLDAPETEISDDGLRFRLVPVKC